MSVLFETPSTAPIGVVERVSVPALPPDAHPVVVAARATWACWRALDARPDLDVSCMENPSHEHCQPDVDDGDDIHWLAWGLGDPRGFDEEAGQWHDTRLIRFEAGLDSRYETAVVEIT